MRRKREALTVPISVPVALRKRDMSVKRFGLMISPGEPVLRRDSK